MRQPDLFLAEALPSGFIYQPDAITRAAEEALVARFAALPFKPFEFHGYLGNRRIVSYGARYDYAARRLREAEPIPDFLFGLRDKAAAVLNVSPTRIAHALVTEYAPGAGIGWHRDKPEFDEVAAFSFLAPARLRFRRKAGASWDRRALDVAPRSLYVLRGESRTVWEHSIPALGELRYSVTFRNLKPDSPE
jgi:alkylated DNA repair dioxygenase AlkB